MDLLWRYVHFLGMLDGAYGLAGLILITGGLLLWFKGGKPSFFYTQNPVFLAKVGLVAVIALLSIYPTVWFILKRKVPDAEVVPVPDAVRLVIRLELVLVFIVPLLAVLMARGVGYR